MGPSWLCAADVLSSSHLREHAWALLACAREEKQRTGRRLCLLPFASLPAFLPYCAVLYSMPWRASHFRGFRNAPNPFDRLRACFLVSPSLPALRACVRTFIDDGCREEALCVLCVLCSCRSFARARANQVGRAVVRTPSYPS